MGALLIIVALFTMLLNRNHISTKVWQWQGEFSSEYGHGCAMECVCLCVEPSMTKHAKTLMWASLYDFAFVWKHSTGAHQAHQLWKRSSFRQIDNYVTFGNDLSEIQTIRKRSGIGKRLLFDWMIYGCLCQYSEIMIEWSKKIISITIL